MTSTGERVKGMVKGALRRATVEPILLLFALAYGFSPTADSSLIYYKTCISLYDLATCNNLHNGSYADHIDVVQRQAAHWQFYQHACIIVPWMLTYFHLNSLTHWFGRTLSVLIPILGALAGTFVNLMLSIFLDTHPGYILIGSTAYGLSGGYPALIGSIVRIRAPELPVDNRVVRLTILEALPRLSAAVSALFSGFAQDTAGFVSVYTVCLALYGASAIYVIVVLPHRLSEIDEEQVAVMEGELSRTSSSANLFSTPPYGLSRSELIASATRVQDVDGEGCGGGGESTNTDTGPRRRHSGTFSMPDVVPVLDSNQSHVTNSSSSADQMTNYVSNLSGGRSTMSFKRVVVRIFSVKQYRDMFLAVTRYREKTRRRCVMIQTLAAFILAMSQVNSLYYLFLRHQPLSFSQSLCGVFVGCSWLGKGAGILLCVLLLKMKTEVRDTTLMICGTLSGIASKYVLAFSYTTWMAFLEPIIGLMASMPVIAIRSVLSNWVAYREKDTMSSAVTIAESLGLLVAAFLYNFVIYPLTVSLFPGLAIVVGASLQVVVLFIFTWLHIELNRLAKYETLQNPVNLRV